MGSLLRTVRLLAVAVGLSVWLAVPAANAQEVVFARIHDVQGAAHLSPFSGQDLLVKVKQREPNAVVVLTSGFGTTQSVIESMKLGAFDFIRKETLPFNLKVVVDAALKAQAEMKAATTFKPQLTSVFNHATVPSLPGGTRSDRTSPLP